MNTLEALPSLGSALRRWYVVCFLLPHQRLQNWDFELCRFIQILWTHTILLEPKTFGQSVHHLDRRTARMAHRWRAYTGRKVFREILYVFLEIWRKPCLMPCPLSNKTIPLRAAKKKKHMLMYWRADDDMLSVDSVTTRHSKSFVSNLLAAKEYSVVRK